MKIHEITQKNLVTAKNIKKALEDAMKNKVIPHIPMDIKCVPEYSDEGELEKWEGASILHNRLDFYKDEKIKPVLEEALRKYTQEDDILVYFAYTQNEHLCRVHTRTKKNVYVNIHKELGKKYKEEMYKEISEKQEYKEYNKDKFETFKEKYTCEYLDENYDPLKYDEFLNKVIRKAKEIQKKEGKVVENMSNFLHNNGIFLLIKDKKDILDGICGYVGEKEMPTIILYLDKADSKNLRRCFFTIAHELYHLLYNEGEYLANKFAGALLVSDIFDDDTLTIDIENKAYTKALLEKYHKKLGISFECIINSLFDSKKIDRDEHSELLRNKRHYINTKNIDLSEEKEWIYKSIPELRK